MKISERKEKDKKVDFEELKDGDCFKDDDGDICIKTDNEQDAVDLRTGIVYADQYGRMVIPVNAEVHIID